MHNSRVLIFLLLIVCGACRRSGPEFRPAKMELWYWHHSYLISKEAVQASKVLIDRAARAGYTGLMLWDSSLIFLSEPGWPAERTEYLREIARYAAAKGMRIMPLAAPYGYSNDVLRAHPNWAEGQRVVGARFRVSADGARLEQVKSLSASAGVAPRETLAMRLEVTPWRQYHVHFICRTKGFAGLAQIEVSGGAENRLDADLHPATAGERAYDYTFNSAASSAVKLTVGVFGPHAGAISVGDFSIEETALVYVVRREGTPLRVYGNGRDYREGVDFGPVRDVQLGKFETDNFHAVGPVAVPAGGALRAGDEVSMDYYAAQPVYDLQVGMCLTDPAVARWVAENARLLAGIFPKGSGLMLSHDEMRHMNNCASCQAKGMTPGDLLAWSMRGTVSALEELGPLYVWSDMFDPHGNARDRFYFVEGGSIAGSWRGLPAGVTVVNWNLNRLRPSLRWFSGDDPRQTVAHRQVIAAYYDPSDKNGDRAARGVFEQALGVPGLAGVMYTTWQDDYSGLEDFARGASQGWLEYTRARPW